MVVLIETKTEDEEFYEYVSGMRVLVLGLFETVPLYRIPDFEIFKVVKTEGFCVKENGRLTVLHYGITKVK
jgi:hypothetical protein